MAKHVFDDLGYRRYEWKCDNQNEASKTTARRATASLSKVSSGQHMISKRAPPRYRLVLDDRSAEWPLS